jgi:hypothetical protein
MMDSSTECLAGKRELSESLRLTCMFSYMCKALVCAEMQIGDFDHGLVILEFRWVWSIGFGLVQFGWILGYIFGL